MALTCENTRAPCGRQVAISSSTWDNGDAKREPDRVNESDSLAANQELSERGVESL